MSNKEEWNKILQIVGEDEYPTDSDFTNKCVKRFNLMRNLLYVVTFAGTFYFLQMGKFIPVNNQTRQYVMAVILIFVMAYLLQRKTFGYEINRYVFRECRPDIGLSRYMNFVPTALGKQMLWSVTQYNFGCMFFRLGEIDKATKCLALMQESDKTAYNMLLALHLKHYIAMYYNDYETVITCADEASEIYPRVKHTTWNNKIYSDLQMYAEYADCYINNDPGRVYSALLEPQERAVDEVARQYYLYLSATAINDFEAAESYKKFVSDNAGTTWYGQAIKEGFTPEDRPEKYPGYVITREMLDHPSKLDNSRLKYLLPTILLLLLVWFLFRLL